MVPLFRYCGGFGGFGDGESGGFLHVFTWFNHQSWGALANILEWILADVYS